MNKILLILLLTISFNASAEWKFYTFKRPTEREDNTPLSIKEIKGYKLYLDGVEYNRSPYIQKMLGGNYFGWWFEFILADIPDTVREVNSTTVDTELRESTYSKTVFN